ncbi:nitroreductase family protein [Streptomyces sp. rh34]|uniref:nitroreductase family protein n=1 Tax=Streptomyces sp. rh34 TaxID=2034272 RepID=UPI000BF2054A|nr:nitroreductase family protein [Streptomyces sp. rh34]
MTDTSDRGGPESPIPDDADVMSRDMRWFTYATGLGVQVGEESVPEPRPDTEVAPALPEAALGDRTPLPRGTTELLERAPYPHGRAGAPRERADALGHALVAGFGLQRREPENPFNDHRPYPSVRAKFPVQVFVRDGRHRRVLDLYRHALTGVGRQDGAAGPLEVALAGRYTRLPDSYRWFRSSLVGLELGVNLRQLCLGLELFGLPGRLRLPDRNAAGLLTDFGLTPEAEWSLPLTVALEDGGPPLAAAPAERAADPVLDGILTVNRSQDFTGPSAPLGPSVPPGLPDDGALSWAEVLWRRSAGRMPRGMYGMSGRRRPVPERTLRETVSWLSVPPPGPHLAAAWEELRLTAVFQGIEGHADGVWHLRDGRPTLHQARPGAAAELEEHYGYPVTPYSGGDVRHASAVWFLSAHPRRLVERLGPGGFTAAQYAAGWAAQGISLAAAATGLYARPVRAFQEVMTRQILGLDPDEMIVCAAITGTPRFEGLLCDLRL